MAKNVGTCMIQIALLFAVPFFGVHVLILRLLPQNAFFRTTQRQIGFLYALTLRDLFVRMKLVRTATLSMLIPQKCAETLSYTDIVIKELRAKTDMFGNAPILTKLEHVKTKSASYHI